MYSTEMLCGMFTGLVITYLTQRLRSPMVCNNIIGCNDVPLISGHKYARGLSVNTNRTR